MLYTTGFLNKKCKKTKILKKNFKIIFYLFEIRFPPPLFFSERPSIPFFLKIPYKKHIFEKYLWFQFIIKNKRNEKRMKKAQKGMKKE